MDYKILFTAFITLFLAELADKTQLTVLALSASSKNPLLVFLGASLALIVSTLLAVLLGSALQKILPVRILHIIAGVIFIVVGGLLLVRNLR
ncbi:MAG: TMEM165/GDT1 family protein [candidate division WOR-3 bacterium]|nr:TMEM165/GDT1 family protein [candidate division WOR-3 bacterium]MCX7757104.1 TMEM165/GDT1 family protein [candidate division WOR-3 bacterium]MDW7988052.1 TMEM165/GDT1 family protein [candidate division WOR-3 bacterium]